MLSNLLQASQMRNGIYVNELCKIVKNMHQSGRIFKLFCYYYLQYKAFLT